MSSTPESRARVFAALSDPTRLRILEILAGEDELCGSEIALRAGVSMALLSHHWNVLADAGVVTKVRRGQRQFCSLERDVLEAAFEHLWPRRTLRSKLPQSA